jgi:hypothetical protein
MKVVVPLRYTSVYRELEAHLRKTTGQGLPLKITGHTFIDSEGRRIARRAAELLVELAGKRCSLPSTMAIRIVGRRNIRLFSAEDPMGRAQGYYMRWPTPKGARKLKALEARNKSKPLPERIIEAGAVLDQHGEDVIGLRRGQSFRQIQLTLGHELGHLALKRMGIRWPERRDEEDICDAVGRALVRRWRRRTRRGRA